MASKIYHTSSSKANQHSLIYGVVRHQRKHLSRYKLKKQVGIIDQILDDPQVMDI